MLAAAVAVGAAGCGGSGHRAAPPLQVVPHVSLVGERRWPLPAEWAVSFDLRLDPGSRLEVGLGSDSVEMTGSGHVERAGRSGALSFRVLHGRADLDALIISSEADRGALLLHRVAELHARLAPGRFPVGADLSDRIHDSTRYWTSGFWPGALWEAAALLGARGGLFQPWALAATIAHFGQERSDTHDVGFAYGESSLAAWRALCNPAPASAAALCSRLKASVLAAADELVALAASNRAAGTVPTNGRGPQADTIIDSMMNIQILPWAGEVTGDPTYAQLASRHARKAAALLVRPDGSTAQLARFDRATGRLLSIGTRQGLAAWSTWSRGQAWAVYGFAAAAAALRDPVLLRVALRVAGYVARRLPAGGIPRWDYDAPSDAPVDVSAGVITAAGLLHLVGACATLPGVCGPVDRWRALARRMLDASLARASTRPPLGFLPDQVLGERGRGCWCDGGELIFGLTYALEAETLLQSRRR